MDGLRRSRVYIHDKCYNHDVGGADEYHRTPEYGPIRHRGWGMVLIHFIQRIYPLNTMSDRVDENIKKESLKKNDNFNWAAFQNWARRDPSKIMRVKKKQVSPSK
jgi:hypothetical protein